MTVFGPFIPFGKEVAGQSGQTTDQSKLVFDGRSIGDQPGVIDIAVVDGSSRIEVVQVCPVEFLKRWMEIAIGGPQGLWCINRVGNRLRPMYLCSGDPSGERHAEAGHAVDHLA